jgi:hypothetical protein
MSLSVDFDRNAVFRAEKVEHIAPGGMLLSKFNAVRSLLQLNP